MEKKKENASNGWIDGDKPEREKGWCGASRRVASLVRGRKSIYTYARRVCAARRRVWKGRGRSKEREREREGGWEEEGGREREGERGAAPTPTRSIRYTSAHQLFGNGDEWEGWPV